MKADPVIGCTTRPHGKLSFVEACERISRAGFSDVALFGNEGQMLVRGDSTEEEIVGRREQAEAAGLRPSMAMGMAGLWEGFETAERNYAKIVEYAGLLGADWVMDCGTAKEEHFEDYYELMRRMAPLAESAGVRIVLKPHGGISLTGEDMLRVRDKVGHSAFGLCYDPGNTLYYTKGEVKPEVDVHSVASDIDVVIIKDFTMVDGKPEVMVTAGDGDVDFPDVLGTLVNAGFEGPYYVECVGSSEPDAIDRDVAFTLGYVREILSGME
jgi:sugar phosphate isomerase/epimerase